MNLEECSAPCDPQHPKYVPPKQALSGSNTLFFEVSQAQQPDNVRSEVQGDMPFIRMFHAFGLLQDKQLPTGSSYQRSTCTEPKVRIQASASGPSTYHLPYTYMDPSRTGHLQGPPPPPSSGNASRTFEGKRVGKGSEVHGFHLEA